LLHKQTLRLNLAAFQLHDALLQQRFQLWVRIHNHLWLYLPSVQTYRLLHVKRAERQSA